MFRELLNLSQIIEIFSDTTYFVARTQLFSLDEGHHANLDFMAIALQCWFRQPWKRLNAMGNTQCCQFKIDSKRNFWMPMVPSGPQIMCRTTLAPGGRLLASFSNLTFITSSGVAK
jgi:hypothetical protein